MDLRVSLCRYLVITAITLGSCRNQDVEMKIAKVRFSPVTLSIGQDKMNIGYVPYIKADEEYPWW